VNRAFEPAEFGFQFMAAVLGAEVGMSSIMALAARIIRLGH
jgi:hypothetical protein